LALRNFSAWLELIRDDKWSWDERPQYQKGKNKSKKGTGKSKGKRKEKGKTKKERQETIRQAWTAPVVKSQDEVTENMMKHAASKGEELVGRDLKVTARLTTRPGPRRSKVTAGPEVRNFKKWSFWKRQGSCACLAKCGDPTGDINFEEEHEKPSEVVVFLVPSSCVEGIAETTAMYVSLSQMPVHRALAALS
jgi:hypothetical protein